MKASLRVSAVQLECSWLDRAANAERMAALVEREAQEHGADLVVFPELASTGYFPEQLDDEFLARLREQAETIPGPTSERLGEVARRHGTHVVAGICELDPEHPGELFNSAVLIGPDGELIGVYRKLHLALTEHEVFTAGEKIPVFDTALGRIAPNICYDVRFPELARVQALEGAEILVSIWAMWEQPGKAPNDSIVVRCRSRATENFFYVVAANRTGSEGGRRYFGRGVIVGAGGDVLSVAEDDREQVLRATLDGVALAEQRAYLSIEADRRPELYGRLVDPAPPAPPAADAG
ncbi:MAG: carbon-nitrogen hydrolase family protein [Actinobacteria bacterium]|nr:carbon-nitrogen hydrolase family protein [Actinomycetota bacterium]